MRLGPIRQYTLLLHCCWAAICLLALVFAYLLPHETAKNFAIETARESLNKDIIYRRWNSSHTGVYVPVTEKTPPNPYLAFRPDRDVITANGQHLTLINPAYMTRQVHELMANESGYKGHITSLNPLRLENSPDTWEESSLRKFEASEKEIFELVYKNGLPFMRAMIPMKTEQRCLNCHAAQGYQLGDIRGGLSVQIPMQDYLAAATKDFYKNSFGIFILWSIGAFILFLLGRKLYQYADAEEQARTELSKREKDYRLLFDNLSSGFAQFEIIFDNGGQPIDYRFLLINPMFTTLTSLTPEQVVGKTIQEVIPKTFTNWIDRFSQVVLSGKPDHFSYFSKILMRHFGVNIYSPEPGKIAILLNDITERMLAEIKVIENEHRYDQLSALTRSVAWEVDSNGLYTFVNSSSLEVFGRTPEELVGKIYFFDLHPEEGRESFKIKAFDYFDRIEPIKDFYNQIHRPDGSIIWVSTTGEAIFDDEGKLLGYRGIDLDITEQKLAKDVLSARLQLMEIASNKSIADIYQATLDIAEELTGSKISFYHQFDEEKKAIVFQTLSTRTAAKLRQADGSEIHYDLEKVEVWADCLRQRRPVVHDNCAAVPKKKGMPPWHAEVVRELVVPVVRNEQIVAILGVGNKDSSYIARDIEVITTLADLSWDIADRKLREEDLIVARDKAESANRAKSEFLANMSHELRTPLNGILGMLQLMEMTEPSHEQRGYIDPALRSGWNLLNLLNDLLDLSCIDAGKLQIRCEPFSLTESVRNINDTFAISIVEKSLDYRCSFDPDLPTTLNGDETRIRQIIFNLLGNAIKFTPEGGQIKLTVSRGARMDSGMLPINFIITDSGIGIETDKLEAVFDPFVQGDNIYTKRYKGAGLGLAIVKRLVEAMNGSIEIESQPGIETTVRASILLPSIAED